MLTTLFNILAQAETATGSSVGTGLGVLGAAVGVSMIVIGAAIGMGKIATGMSEGMARQPEVAGQIRGSAMLLGFLLEGIALFACVIALIAAGKLQ